MTDMKLMYFFVDEIHIIHNKFVNFQIWIIRIHEFQWNPQSSLRLEQGNIITKDQPYIFGLSFERPYLIKGLNLMMAKSIKSVDFGVGFMDFDADFDDFAEIRGFPHFSLNLQEDNIYVKRKTIFA